MFGAPYRGDGVCQHPHSERACRWALVVRILLVGLFKSRMYTWLWNAKHRKNLKNWTNSPLAPSITPIRTQTPIFFFVALGPRYNMTQVIFKFDKAFWRNTRPRNRPDFVENGGHIRGAVSRLPRKVARVCDTRLLQDVPAYEMRHKSNFYLKSFRSNRPSTCWS